MIKRGSPVLRSFASAVLVGSVACRPEYDPASFEPARPRRGTDVQIDTLVQVTTPEVDVLFVVDNSASMSDDQYELGNSFDAFLVPFLGAGFDWHIGVVSTDLFDENQGGRLRPFGDLLWIDPTTENPEFVFEQLVNVGTHGAAAEAGIGVTWRAIAEHGEGANAGFYRDAAAFHAVIVSDEEDATPEDFLTVDSFEAWMLELKGSGGDSVSFSSIVNPSGCDCPGAESAGLRYISVTNTVGGLMWDLHDPEGWVQVLDGLAAELTELQEEFFLSRRPIVETLDVHIDDGASTPMILGEGVSYDAQRNSVVFDVPPPPSSTVVLYYEVED